jgi:RNA polymerase sigma-70 factor (ECF subfamily)
MPPQGEMSAEHTAAEIAARHHAGLYRFALAIAGGDRHEAEEIVQSCYLEVLEGRDDLTRANDPRAFLFGVARRIAASRRRRRSILGRILRLDFERRDAAPLAPSPEDESAGNEIAGRVRAAMRALDGRQVEVAALVFGEGLTVEQAAAAIGVSVGSARTHYHRAKQKLARLLEDGDAHAR